MESDLWLGVELRHLAALQAIAEEGSFGRAAKRLGYTQSAISQQVATLERIVGEKLVERPGGPRPVALTEAGRLFSGPARRSAGGPRPRRPNPRRWPPAPSGRCGSARTRAWGSACCRRSCAASRPPGRASS